MAAESALSLWWIDATRYAVGRDRFRAGDPGAASVQRRLQTDAATAAANPIRAVTDRQPTPHTPTDDPHDYVSIATYWWPNPDSPDGMPWASRDGIFSPDLALYDRPRWDATAHDIIALCRAAWLLHDASAADAAAVRLRRWFLDPASRMNPNVAHGQFVPGRNTGRQFGIIDFALTLPSVLDHVTLLRDLPDSPWTATDHAALRDWCAAFLHWHETHDLALAEEQSKNNHGVYFDRLVVALALFVERPDRAAQQLARTRDRIASQIEPDGSMPHELGRTCSFGYSLMNARAFLELATIGRRIGSDLWTPLDDRRIGDTVDFLAGFVGERDWPYEQIEPIDWRMMTLLFHLAGDLRGEPYDMAALTRRLPADFDRNLFPLYVPLHPFGSTRSPTASA